MTDDAKSTSAAPSALPEEGDDPASARAKPLPRRLPVVPQDSPAPALIPARMINEVLYIWPTLLRPRTTSKPSRQRSRS